MVKAVKCKRCGQEPKTKEISGCWYTWCDSCCRENKDYSGRITMYDFLGMTETASIKNWNEINDKPVSEAKIAAISRQKARFAAMRKAKEEAAKQLPRFIGIENLKPKRL